MVRVTMSHSNEIHPWTKIWAQEGLRQKSPQLSVATWLNRWQQTVKEDNLTQKGTHPSSPLQNVLNLP